MKILLVNTHLTGGGAAIAAARLAEALSKVDGVEVAFLYLVPSSKEPPAGVNAQCLNTNGELSLRDRINFVCERLQIFIHNGFHKKRLFYVSTALWGRDISKHPLVKWADLIHLHWINQGMLSLKGLERLAKLGKPICWTLHDLWPVTAISPLLKDMTVYESPWDGKEMCLVRRVAKCKKRIYKTLQPHFIGCSHWICEQAKLSQIGAPYPIEEIPNGINTALYCPFPGGIEVEKPVKRILFGAVKTSDLRKGFKEMLATLSLLLGDGTLKRHNVVIETFGYLSEDAQEQLAPYKPINHGFIEGSNKMIDLYRNATILVVPSLYENLPNTVMESMACGTPVVAFKVGGIPEMIAPSRGFVCQYGSPEALAEGIRKALNLSPEEYLEMSSQCRDFVVQHYHYDSVARRHVECYSKMLDLPAQ